jgi:hypothetical protein
VTLSTAPVPAGSEVPGRGSDSDADDGGFEEWPDELSCLMMERNGADQTTSTTRDESASASRASTDTTESEVEWPAECL